jgi:hypothetical protein
MRKLISITLAVAVLLFGGTTPAAAACATGQTEYVVKTGDNLFRIGLRYGVPWPTLAALNTLPNANLIYVGQALCIPPATPTTPPPTPISAPPPAGTVPTITITAVRANQTVTISAVNFPTNQKFEVRMGPFGTLGINGIVAGSQDSGTGEFTANYNIPAALQGSYRIAIRLDSAYGYYSFNWFYNSSTN